MKWLEVFDFNTDDSMVWYSGFKNVVEKSVNALTFNDDQLATTTSGQEALDIVVKELNSWIRKESEVFADVRNLQLKVYQSNSIAIIRRMDLEITLFQVQLKPEEIIVSRDGEERSGQHEA